MAKIPATEFKARCLELMDRVADRRETYVITKRGKPVAKLVPVDAPRTTVLGALEGRFRSVDDIVAPVYTDDEWNHIKHENDEQWRRWMEEPASPPSSRARPRKSR